MANPRALSSPRWQRTALQNVLRYVPSGMLYVRARVGGGRERWKSLRTKSVAVAKLNLPAALAALRVNGEQSADISLGEAAAVFLEGKRVAGLKPSAVKYREETISALRGMFARFDDLPAALVSEQACRDWSERARAEYSASRFNGMLESLRGIFSAAGLTGERNPARHLKRARVVVAEKPVLDSAQLSKLFAALRRPVKGQRAGHGYFLAKFLCYFSSRVGTARRLTPAMVNRERLQFEIPAEWVKRGRAGEIFRAPIFPPMLELLDELDAKFGKARPWLLPIGEVRRPLERRCKELGLPRLTHHTFRHIFTTHALIQTGGDVPTVAHWRGDKDGGAMLLRTYSHLLDQHSRKMAKRVKF